MEVRLLYFEGCPHWTLMAERLREALALSGNGETIEVFQVDTEEAAEGSRSAGSPTVLLDGRDPFPSALGAFGLTRRKYVTPDGPQGAPTVEQLVEAIEETARA